VRAAIARTTCVSIRPGRGAQDPRHLAPLARWNDGWQAAGHRPVMLTADALTEAFLWSELRTVTKTATVSLHGNSYQVEAALVVP
jgi:hypothetical protein